MYSSLLSMKAPSNLMIHGCGGSVCSSLTSLMHRSRAFASIVSKIETFLSATRFASELRVARCTTEKWPRPMAFSTVKSSSVPPPKSRPDALAEPSAMLSNGWEHRVCSSACAQRVCSNGRLKLANTALPADLRIMPVNSLLKVARVCETRARVSLPPVERVRWKCPPPVERKPARDLRAALAEPNALMIIARADSQTSAFCSHRQLCARHHGHLTLRKRDRGTVMEPSNGMQWVEVLLESHPQMADFKCPL